LSTTKAATIIFSILALVAIWTFLFALYREYRRDALRVKLRRIRDRVWDLAIERGWPPLEAEVKSTLDYAGAAIRAAAGMTLWRWLLFQAAGPLMPELRAPAQADEARRPELEQFREEIRVALAGHLVVFRVLRIVRRMEWPPAGTVEILIRTAAFSTVLSHEAKH
jgi:hypothetical protein